MTEIEFHEITSLNRGVTILFWSLLKFLACIILAAGIVYSAAAIINMLRIISLAL